MISPKYKKVPIPEINKNKEAFFIRLISNFAFRRKKRWYPKRLRSALFLWSWKWRPLKGRTKHHTQEHSVEIPTLWVRGGEKATTTMHVALKINGVSYPKLLTTTIFLAIRESQPLPHVFGWSHIFPNAMSVLPLWTGSIFFYDSLQLAVHVIPRTVGTGHAFCL